MRIAILGGGYTGLVAALRLAEDGHDVTILERGELVGGLASGFKVEGESLERGYHHLFKTDQHIIRLANELNVGNKLEWHDSSVAIYYDKKLYPFATPLDLLRFKPLHLHNRIRTGLVLLYLQLSNNWQPLRNKTAYEWMLRWAGKQSMKVIWEPLLKGKFDRFYKKISMAWLWARIHIRANSREKGDNHEKLGYFNGGFQVFTDALVQRLQELGVDIRTNSEIQSIRSLKSDKVKIVHQDKTAVTYDACIATVPSYVFAKLIEGNEKTIPSKYIKNLNSIQYLGARLLIFSSSQDLSPYYWHNINDVTMPFLVFINHTKLVGTDNYHGKNVYYIGTYLPRDHELFTLDDRQLENIWFKAVKTIFPNFDTNEINEKHHFKFANAQHIVDTTYNERIPSYVTPMPNVYLANFSQIYPEDRGTNYAVREGEYIAKLVSERSNR